MSTLTLADRSILKPFIRGGRVDYDALAARLSFAGLCDEIAGKDLAAASTEEQLAFYLNAYNLLTLTQVLSCLEEDPEWPGPVSLLQKARFFFWRRHTVAGERMSLYRLENSVIRHRYQEPRIHFALNCASASCPHLPGQLFVAATLDADLELFTHQFINSEAVQVDDKTNTVRVSPIFKWYRRDFGPSVTDFIGRYRPLPDQVKLRYLPYDWRLNAMNSARDD